MLRDNYKLIYNKMIKLYNWGKYTENDSQNKFHILSIMLNLNLDIWRLGLKKEYLELPAVFIIFGILVIIGIFFLFWWKYKIKKKIKKRIKKNKTIAPIYKAMLEILTIYSIFVFCFYVWLFTLNLKSNIWLNLKREYFRLPAVFIIFGILVSIAIFFLFLWKYKLENRIKVKIKKNRSIIPMYRAFLNVLTIYNIFCFCFFILLLGLISKQSQYNYNNVITILNSQELRNVDIIIDNTNKKLIEIPQIKNKEILEPVHKKDWTINSWWKRTYFDNHNIPFKNKKVPNPIHMEVYGTDNIFCLKEIYIDDTKLHKDHPYKSWNRFSWGREIKNNRVEIVMDPKYAEKLKKIPAKELEENNKWLLQQVKNSEERLRT